MSTTTQLSLRHLSAIFDSITRDIERFFETDDINQLERRFGALTLLHESQVEISKHIGMFAIERATWYPGQVQRIKEIRVSQGLPPEATEEERKEWTTV